MKYQKGAVGLLLLVAGVLIVLIFFVLRGGQFLNRIDNDSDIKQLQEQSTSDEISAIESDLENTDLDNLDSELMEIDKELDQAY